MATQPKGPQKPGSRWGWMQQAVASVESRLDTILGEEETAASAGTRPASQPAPVTRDSLEASRSGASTPANDRLQARLAQAMGKKGSASRPDTPVQPPEPASDKDEPGQERPASGLSSHRPSGPNAQQSPSARPSADSGQADAAEVSSQLDQDKAVQEMSDEITSYIEKIDTLQAKLKYLASEAAESAKQAAAAAQNGTAEKKLLEKDVQISLLMQEGQTLSKTEMKHLQTIKKIRQQFLASTKENEQSRARADKAERSLRSVEDRARRAEAAAKRAEQNLAASLNSTSDFDAIKKERDALDATLADIRAQLSRANARAEAAESKAATEQLERERKKNAELHDDLTSSKIERELAEEKLRREIKDLRSSLEREKEHARVIETEMLGEQAALESKLESFRARAEEASSSTQGSVQAKLLRQIETLQNQYSAASQNWQRIEGSLLARITGLEKERDEIAARESDVRRRVREATLKARKAEAEVEEGQARLAELEKSQIEADEEAHRAARRIKQLEADVLKAQQDLAEQKAQAQKDLHSQLEEERAKWAASLLQTPRLEPSPLATLRRGSSLGLVDLASPLERAGLGNGTIAESASLVTSNDADEYFNHLPHTPGSLSHVLAPQPPLPDLVSNSTVGAGPSVQLVERLSANVRRLESEKAASKDEITRLTAQRDQARQEVVGLVREADAKRRVDERLQELAAQHQELRQRHQTTLELLGERSEQVEELKADIVDVKAMYRQLADTIGKA
ncbi:hypothetical protein DV737_g1028, partial [Chaetothyriales sp. CBS 132003]